VTGAFSTPKEFYSLEPKSHGEDLRSGNGEFIMDFRSGEGIPSFGGENTFK
jgi:hypothetical protein